jgi:outer membrane protein assembly factor BamD (BamD/ComL family)
MRLTRLKKLFLTIVYLSLFPNPYLSESALAQKKGILKSAKSATSAPSEIKETQVNSSYRALFAMPNAPELRSMIDLVGQNKELATGMQWSPESAVSREAQLKQLRVDFRLQKPKSPQQMQLGVKLLKVIEEQVMYQERFRAIGNYPSTDSAIQKTKLWEMRQELIKHVNVLLAGFGQSEFSPAWKLAALSARLKIEDPSAVGESLSLIKSKPDYFQRLKLIGLAMGLSKGQESNAFGKTADARFLSELDETSSAILEHYLGQIEKRKNQKNKAKEHFLSSAKKFKPELGSVENGNSFVLLNALLATQLTQQEEKINPGLIQSLNELQFLNATKSYIESVALRTLLRNYKLAIGLYEDILKVGEPSSSEVFAVESRILDIYLDRKDVSYFESQWDKFAKLEGAGQSSTLNAKISKTQAITVAKAFSAKNQEHVGRFVRLHDFFSKLSPSYGSSDSMNLKVIESLFFIQSYSDAINRSEALASRSKNKQAQASALRFAARGREFLLGLKPKVDFDPKRNLAQKQALAQEYVSNLDRLGQLVALSERQEAQFQAAYVEHQSRDLAEGRKRFELVIAAYPAHSYSKAAAEYVLNASLAQKNYEYTERFARLLIRSKVTPAGKQIPPLVVVVETNMFSHADQLGDQGQLVPSGDKFLAFQREFPSSKKAPQAVLNASANYQKANKGELSLGAKELFLKLYPKDAVSQELRWRAAEQAKTIGQLLRAAGHFEAYATLYPKDAVGKKALVQASLMHKGLGRYANAVVDLESFIKSTSDKSQQALYLKEIAELQDKYGKPTDATSVLHRLIAIKPSEEEQIWALGKLVGIYSRTSQIPKLRAAIGELVSKKPKDENSQKEILKARHILGKLDQSEIGEFAPIREKNLLEGTKKLIARYDVIKANLLAPCEIAGLDWCSVGYFEASKVAEVTAQKLLEVDPPPTLNPREVNQIRSLVQEQGERLGLEAKQLAEQAEQALASGAPDEETAERIRSHAQNHRGDLAEGLKTK